MPPVAILKREDNTATPSHHPTVRGLVVLNPVGRYEPGMNRSLLLAMPDLERRGVALATSRPTSTFGASKRFLRALAQRARGQLDFVLINSLGALANPGAHGWFWLRAAKLTRIPLAIYWHETDWVFARLRARLPQLYDALLEACSDPSILHLSASRSCSDSLRRLMPTLRPVEVYECARIPPSFDAPVPPADPPTVINIASVQPRKGTDLFAQTAIRVCRQHPDVRFLWLGSGSDFGDWRQRVKDSGFADRIRFPGHVDAPYGHLQEASVMFLSSRDDPFPLAILEAMCLQRPIVAFDVGGVPEQFGEPGNGELIRPFDTTAAADAILRCLQLPPDQRLKPALRERYMHLYTPDAFAANLAQLLVAHTRSHH